jgi:polyhydroxyalkanoate synthesis regulator phasin
MPQPKKSPATRARKPAAAKKPATAAKKPAATRQPAARRKPAAAAPPAPATTASPGLTPMPTTPEEVVANLNALRERLVSSLTLTTERLQDAVDDAVRRGRMTRKDAEDLFATLVSAGRAQTEQLLADIEQLLGRGRGGDGLRESAAESSDVVLRTVDRARRRVSVGTFPILGYDDLNANQITKRLVDLTPAQLRKVRDHERRHDARKSVLGAIERRLG